MHALQLHTYLHLLFLLFLPHLPFLVAQAHIRAKAPAPTAAPLFLRQITTCDAGLTSCHDGLPGCCGIGEACTVDTSSVPLCIAKCNGGPTCSGVFSGHCCEFGYTCDYQATLCGSNTNVFSVMSLTGSLPPKSSAAADPTSVVPPSRPVPPPPAPVTASQPIPPARTAAKGSQAVQPSAVAISSSELLVSSLAVASKTDPLPYSYGPPSFSLPSISAYSYSISTSLETPTTMPTAIQQATVTTTVKSNAGQRTCRRGLIGNAVLSNWLLTSVLAMMLCVLYE